MFYLYHNNGCNCVCLRRQYEYLVHYCRLPNRSIDFNVLWCVGHESSNIFQLQNNSCCKTITGICLQNRLQSWLRNGIHISGSLNDSLANPDSGLQEHDVNWKHVNLSQLLLWSFWSGCWFWSWWIYYRPFRKSRWRYLH